MSFIVDRAYWTGNRYRSSMLPGYGPASPLRHGTNNLGMVRRRRCKTLENRSGRRAVSGPIRPINDETHAHCLNVQRVRPSLRRAGVLAAVPRAEFFGVAEKDKPPIRFGAETNLLWKVEVPPGLSAPCLAGRRIFSHGL